MAYDKTKIYEQALELSKKIEIKDFAFAESIWNKENKFKSEKEFIDNLIDRIPSIIKNMYNLDCINYDRERPFWLKEFGLVNTRCDLIFYTEQGINIVIECKNPTHDKAETFNAIGQMIAYKLNIDAMPGNFKLILATSIFDFNALKAIKRYNLDFDLIYHNKLSTSFTLYNYL